MCIWEIDPEKRRCEFCSYRGGCEKYHPERALNAGADAECYVGIMSSIIGTDILNRSRDHRMVWARNIVAYQMRRRGHSLSSIGKCLGLDHSTVAHCERSVKDMLFWPSMYPEEIKIWQNFQEKLSLQKNMALC